MVFQDKLDELAGQEGQAVAPHEKIITNLPEKKSPETIIFQGTYFWSDADAEPDDPEDLN